MISDQQRERVIEDFLGRAALSNPSTEARRGEEIFSRPGPRTWADYIGQARSKAQLQASIAPAKARETRLEHVLIAAGQYGAGKSALARLVAAEMGVGIVELSGVITVDEVRPILRQMKDRDVLFIDEIHQMVSGGKVKVEWLLHLLEDGRLLTARGSEPMPAITVIAATTDAGKLPETVISRFPIRPVLDGYTQAEATTIVLGMAADLGFGSSLPRCSQATGDALATACSRNPRDMRALLTTLRDAAYGGQAEVDEHGDFDLTATLRWAGLTFDGLSQPAQDYLSILAIDFDGTAGERTIAAAMGEPGPLRHVEKVLLQKGLIQITANGRSLTDRGFERVNKLLGGDQ